MRAAVCEVAYVINNTNTKMPQGQDEPQSGGMLYLISSELDF